MPPTHTPSPRALARITEALRRHRPASQRLSEALRDRPGSPAWLRRLEQTQAERHRAQR